MAVIDNNFETKGTHLFFYNPIGSDAPQVTKMTCPTALPGINGGSKDRIDVTCLDETGVFRKYLGGFADASEITIPFILYKSDGSHQDLFDLQAGGQVVNWFVGLSDSTDAPTLDSDNNLVPPATRTGFNFNAYVSNLTIDAALNEVVRGSLTLQPSGGATPHWAA